MTAKSHFFVSFLKFNTGAARAQGIQYSGLVITQAGHNTHAGNYNTFHRLPLINLPSLSICISGGVKYSEIRKPGAIMPHNIALAALAFQRKITKIRQCFGISLPV